MVNVAGKLADTVLADGTAVTNVWLTDGLKEIGVRLVVVSCTCWLAVPPVGALITTWLVLGVITPPPDEPGL
jgi:hypothetical protein